jgi:hypothetical protein
MVLCGAGWLEDPNLQHFYWPPMLGGTMCKNCERRSRRA